MAVKRKAKARAAVAAKKRNAPAADEGAKVVQAELAVTWHQPNPTRLPEGQEPQAIYQTKLSGQLDSYGIVLEISRPDEAMRFAPQKKYRVTIEEV